MTLRCIAIDDEPPALRILADDLQKIPSLDLIGTFNSPLRALEAIRQHAPDLLFLDIQMPTLLGTELLRALAQPPMVIFTTAYEQYALESYELDVVDYLLKPIRFERLLRACHKAAEVYAGRHRPAESIVESSIVAPAETFFFVFSEYKEVKVYFHDVQYVEGLKDYVKIFLDSQPRPLLTRLNMKALETRLDPARFCRIHQSYIVPLDRITAFQKTSVRLGMLELPVGGRYADAFLARYRSA